MFKFDLCSMLGDRPGMRAALQSGARETSDPSFGEKLAGMLEEDGDFAKALQWRRWVAQFLPEDEDTLLRLARTAIQAGQAEEAEATYGHLLGLKDGALSDPRLSRELGGEDYPPELRPTIRAMALRLLQRSLAGHERNGSRLEGAARFAYQLGDRETCRDYLQKAVQLNPFHPSCAHWKSELFRIRKELSGEA